MKKVVAKSGRNPDEFALHSLLTRDATTLTAGEAIAERVFQREGRWRSDAYKAYARNDIDDTTRGSRKVARANVARERQPGEETVWGMKYLRV